MATQIFEEETTLGELGEQSFNLNYSGLVKDVSVAPVLVSQTGKEILGSVVDKLEFSDKQIIKNLGGVSWWKLNGNAQDEIGSNDGTKVGDPQYIKDNERGKVVDLDGDDAITIVGSGSLEDVTDDGNSFSFSVWFKPSGLPQQTNTGYIIMRRGFHLGIAYTKSDGSLSANLRYNDFTSTTITEDILQTGIWYHLVMTVDESNNEFKLYKDGEQVDSTIAITKPLREYGQASYDIGGRGDYIAYGAIDEPMIFNRALSESEVKALYELDLS